MDLVFEGLAKTEYKVRALAEELQVWQGFVGAVQRRLPGVVADVLITRIGNLPVRDSRAVGLLGSYQHRGSEPLAIRLQSRQERTQLGITLLHELAHACDHLTAVAPYRHRCTHGRGWRSWAQAFAIAPVAASRSPALAALRQARLKPVAVCERCGTVFHRVRRLPARRRWLHPQCGNGRVLPLADSPVTL